jgi:hypothetical protein
LHNKPKAAVLAGTFMLTGPIKEEEEKEKEEETSTESKLYDFQCQPA